MLEKLRKLWFSSALRNEKSGRFGRNNALFSFFFASEELIDFVSRRFPYDCVVILSQWKVVMMQSLTTTIEMRIYDFFSDSNSKSVFSLKTDILSEVIILGIYPWSFSNSAQELYFRWYCFRFLPKFRKSLSFIDIHWIKSYRRTVILRS